MLSALWNLSAHSTENKAAICQVDGALGFLVSTLTYRCQSNSLAIIESGGGILRNVSSLIATREDYRSAPTQAVALGAGGQAGRGLDWALSSHERTVPRLPRDCYYQHKYLPNPA